MRTPSATSRLSNAAAAIEAEVTAGTFDSLLDGELFLLREKPYEFNIGR